MRHSSERQVKLLEATTDERLICWLAGEILDGESVAIGNNSAIPAAAALLAKETHAPNSLPVILGDDKHWPFQGMDQFFAWIQRGEADLFFLGGAQIDAYGSVNLTVIGEYDRPKVRLPGGAGSGMLYYRCRRVVLFKTDHHVKGFPDRLDFKTANASPQWREPGFGILSGVYTPIALLKPALESGRLILSQTAEGISPEEVLRRTGFNLAVDKTIGLLKEPTAYQLEKLRTVVKEALKRTYPAFAVRRL